MSYTEDDNKIMHSYHIFMLPFRWKNILEKESPYASLKEKFNLGEFENNLITQEPQGKWERRQFVLDHPAKYNEYNYFYDFVREVLYDLDEDLRTKQSEINNELIRHYEYKMDEKKYYHIKIKEGKHYALEIDSILLNIYGTGTGILSFHLRNREYPEPEDILKINQYGRRIYPPFFGLTDDDIFTGKLKKHGSFDEEDKNKLFNDNGAKIELADAIWIDKNKNESNDTPQQYNFEEYIKDKSYYKHGPFYLPKFIRDLFPKNFFAEHQKEIKRGEEQSKVYIRPGLDDRMYVVSWYGNDGLANHLSQYHCQSYKYETDDWWYKYIFVDANVPMVANERMKKSLIEQTTYARWVEWGTLFGASRYSLVMLTSKNPPPFLIRHLQTMYYKMAELVLLQRTSVIAFSDEVTHISDLVHNNKEAQSIKYIQNLYALYILFVNKIYFREITAQEQGIEMYDLMHKVMRIPEHVKDLDDELDELKRYADMLEQKKENEEMKKHTILATIFLPVMLFTAFLGMNTMPEKWTINFIPYWPFWISFITTILLVYIFARWGNTIIEWVINIYNKAKNT